LTSSIGTYFTSIFPSFCDGYVRLRLNIFLKGLTALNVFLRSPEEFEMSFDTIGSGIRVSIFAKEGIEKAVYWVQVIVSSLAP
jgi:hypothetical protein